MRYFLEPEQDVLAWCLSHDRKPHVLPRFPTEKPLGLVCAHLIEGKVFAEVVTSADNLVEICGVGFPLGRLYFQIPKSALYMVCPPLTPAAFQEGGTSA